MATLTLEDKVSFVAAKIANSFNLATKATTIPKVLPEALVKVILEALNKTDEQYRQEALAKLTPLEQKILS